MSDVQFPSVQVDDFVEDTLDATSGSCLSGSVAPFALLDTQTLDVDVDGGGPTTITFFEVDFDDISVATIEEVVNAITAQLTGAVASDDSGKLRITSDSFGLASTVEITGGTAAGAFAFPAGPCVGTEANPAILIINRSPEPDEVAVPRDSAIRLDVYGTAGGVPEAEIQVYVNGVLAFDQGALANGFTVGVVPNPDAQVVRFQLVPPALLPEGTLIPVRVLLTGATPLDETWTFTAFDEAPPLMASVQARGKQLIRVTFNEPVKQVDPAASDDALNPANYLFERLSRPAVTVVATAVNAVDALTVDVTTDIELTFGAPYLIIAQNIVDLFDNAFLAPSNVLEFNAFLPPFPAGRRFRLAEFVPTINLSEDVSQEFRLFLGVLQEVTNLMLCEIDEWTNILDPDLAPEPFLDAMLLDLGNPFGEFVLTEIDKRRLIRLLVQIYRSKGTGVGIINVIRFFIGIDVTIEVFNGIGWELTDEGADPDIGDELSDDDQDADVPAILGPDPSGLYSFSIISPVDLTTEQRERIVSIVDLMKPAHTHLVSIQEPSATVVIDHAELGLSELGSGTSPGTFILHEA